MDDSKPLDGGKAFQDFLGKLVQVPKKELDRRIKAERRAKKQRKPKQS